MYFGWNDTRTLGAGNGKTRFIHSDEMIGGMTWLIGGMMMKIQKNLYTRFNRELKMEVEQSI